MQLINLVANDININILGDQNQGNYKQTVMSSDSNL